MKILKEMSIKRGDAISAIMARNDQRFLNLIKIFLFRDTTTIRHWCGEFRATLKSNFKLKQSNDYAPLEFLRDFMWHAWEDTFDDIYESMVKQACKEESKPIPSLYAHNLYKFCEEFIMAYTAMLYELRGNMVEVDDMIACVNSVLPKYPIVEEETK